MRCIQVLVKDALCHQGASLSILDAPSGLPLLLDIRIISPCKCIGVGRQRSWKKKRQNKAKQMCLNTRMHCSAIHSLAKITAIMQTHLSSPAPPLSLLFLRSQEM